MVPSDDAVDPGVMVMVQLLLAVSVLPQVVELVVPAGQVGADTATLIAGLLPVLVTVIERAAPDEGVPLTPYSVSPVTLRAILLTLMARVVELLQVRLTFVTFAPPMVPLPLVTTQVCADGWFCTVTEYAPPSGTAVANANAPSAPTVNASLPLFASTSVPSKPVTVPPTAWPDA